MEIRAFGQTDVGKVRGANEDGFLIDEERKLYIVADGMGGHQGGGYASSHAVQGIREETMRLEQVQDSTQPLEVPEGKTRTQVRLQHALSKTNNQLYQKAQEDPSLRGMGTTVTAMQLDSNFANIAHVGDSRLYLLRDGDLKQLTRDHSWVQEQVDAGVLSDDEAETHPLKNIITRSMGHEPELLIDLLKEEYRPGDKFLLCSDGLTNMVDDRMIKEVLEKKGPQPAVEELVRLSLDAGGLDNITALIVEIAG